MISIPRLDRKAIVLVVIGLLIVSAGAFGVLILDQSETLPVYTATSFDTTYNTSNDTLRITHVGGDTLCANETYVVIQRNDTQGTVTRAWVTANSKADRNGLCQEVSVTDSFVLADADLEPGDRVKVIWQTNRESVPKDERRKVLAIHEISGENTTSSETTAST